MTPNTSPPSKIGKPNAACSRSRAATGVRWKLASRTRSEMYLGLRLSHTLPGNPTPARKVLSRLADSNSGTSLDGLCQISTQRSTPASRSTRHSAPTSQPRHSPKARSIFGVASATVAASARICVTMCCMSLIASLSGCLRKSVPGQASCRR